MNIQQANFEDLLGAYYHGKKARTARKLLGLIRREDHLRLANLLRDYRSRSVWSEQAIADRAAIDQLMICYSVMEIASGTGMVPDLRDTAFGKESERILEHKQVRRYYEEFYPTRMPQLFRHRLAGNGTAHNRQPEDKVSAAFMAFLELDRRFMENLEDETLLRMLDSFKIDDYWFADVVAIIRKPKVFIEHLMCAPAKRDARSWALQEFSIFMQFCFDLHELLGRLEKQPVLQSAIWNHYSYWFEIIGEELREQLGKALEKFLDWEPPAGNREAAEQIQQYVHQTSALFKDLTSRRFAGPVEELLRDATRQAEMPIHFVSYKDVDGRYTFANEHFCRLIERNLDELAGKTDFDFFPEELAKSYRREDMKIICGHESCVKTVENFFASGGGKMLYIKGLRTPLFGAGERIIGVRHEFEDITEDISGKLQRSLKLGKPFKPRKH